MKKRLTGLVALWLALIMICNLAVPVQAEDVESTWAYVSDSDTLITPDLNVSYPTRLFDLQFDVPLSEQTELMSAVMPKAPEGSLLDGWKMWVVDSGGYLQSTESQSLARSSSISKETWGSKTTDGVYYLMFEPLWFVKYRINPQPTNDNPTVGGQLQDEVQGWIATEDCTYQWCQVSNGSVTYQIADAPGEGKISIANLWNGTYSNGNWTGEENLIDLAFPVESGDLISVKPVSGAVSIVQQYGGAEYTYDTTTGVYTANITEDSADYNLYIEGTDPFVVTISLTRLDTTYQDLPGQTTKTLNRAGLPGGTYACKVTFDPDGDALTLISDQVHYDSASYCVVYDLNGGTGATGVDYSTFTVTDGTEITLNAAPTREGYTFTGWSDGKQVYQPEAKITVNANLTLTAQWTKEHVVTYDLNGGTGATGVDYSTFTVTDGTEITLNAAPTREGYTFTGWSDGKQIYQPNDKITVNANLTLTAQWEETLGSATLLKVDADNPSVVLPGVVFALYQADGQLAGNYTTDENGLICVSGLSAGAYFWQEVRAAEGYLRADDVFPIEVKPGEDTAITVENQRNTVPEMFSTEHYAYIIGSDDGLVHPEDNITRAEVVTIFFRLLNQETRMQYLCYSNNFSDVSKGTWYNTAISTMAALGIVNGYPDGSFRPNSTITRAEFATIAARFACNANATGAAFTDIAGHWAADYILIAANNGWVQGYEDGTFRPNRPITRAEAISLTNRVLQRLPESEADLLEGMIVWLDNMDTSKWYYLAIQEATNSHTYARKDNGYEYWTGIEEVPDWGELENP